MNSQVTTSSCLACLAFAPPLGVAAAALQTEHEILREKRKAANSKEKRQ